MNDSDRVFLDTNILVYAHDLDAGAKYARASELVEHLWETRRGVLSTQVLQEFIETVTRKIPFPISIPEARLIARNYCAWEMIVNDSDVIFQATEIQEAHALSFWDALIVSAAFTANASVIATEDMNHDQRIEGILIINPFIDGPSPPLPDPVPSPHNRL
jgi:predicted nucleic acid-binding protein